MSEELDAPDEELDAPEELDEGKEKLKFAKFAHAIAHNEPLFDEDIPTTAEGFEKAQAALKEEEKMVDLTDGSKVMPEITPAEKERRHIFGEDHYYATPDEVVKMSPDEYARWREAGSFLAPSEAQIAEVKEREAETAKRVAENEMLESMTVEQYAAHKETLKTQAKAKEEAEKTERETKEKERKEKLSGPKTMEDLAAMSMEEYAEWHAQQE